MKLFNEFKNEIFSFLTDYINSCYYDSSNALTEEDFRLKISSIPNNTELYLADALINRNTQENSFNACLFYRNPEGKIMPIIYNTIHVPTSFVERAWLHYVLSDHKSSIFINAEEREALLNKLDFPDGNPISCNNIDIRYPSGCKPDSYSESTIQIITTVLQSLTEKKSLILTNKAVSGKVYTNEAVVPYKLEYTVSGDFFSLSAWSLSESRPLKMLVSGLTNVRVGESVKDFDSYKEKAEKALHERICTSPVSLLITDYNNGFDRAGYVLSSYDRISHRDENNNLIMELSYYSFQEYELIQKLLFLGQAVTVLGPEDFKEKFVQTLKETLNNYK